MADRCRFEIDYKAECARLTELLDDNSAKLTAIEEIVKEHTMRQRPWVTAEDYLKRIAALIGVK